VHCRSASRTGGAAPRTVRHAHGREFAGRRLSRRRIRLDATTETPPFVAVTLEHADAALSLPLFASTDTDDIVAEWQIWGRVLGLPLLIGDTDGDAKLKLLTFFALSSLYPRQSLATA
jgi:hypothetical protein